MKILFLKKIRFEFSRRLGQNNSEFEIALDEIKILTQSDSIIECPS
jgi:hypothetical protein